MAINICMASDHVLATLISGLEIEFGGGAGEALAHRFLGAEEVDFHWDARIEEHWIGAYQSAETDELDLDRVAILGKIDGEWFVAQMIVDGNGEAHGLISRRGFESVEAARKAFAIA